MSQDEVVVGYLDIDYLAIELRLASHLIEQINCPVVSHGEILEVCSKTGRGAAMNVYNDFVDHVKFLEASIIAKPEPRRYLGGDARSDWDQRWYRRPRRRRR